jgi:hypothetical protein
MLLDSRSIEARIELLADFLRGSWCVTGNSEGTRKWGYFPIGDHTSRTQIVSRQCSHHRGDSGSLVYKIAMFERTGDFMGRHNLVAQFCQEDDQGKR